MTLSLDKLQDHLYSLPNLPNAIPYVTSYYERRWGFCISHNQRKSLKDGIYEVFIDTEFKEDGELNYGEILIPTSKTKDEILISTYLCHPQMANNELSGPIVWSELIKWVKTLKNRSFNYRFIIIPETIGSICYISKNFRSLKQNVKAGFVLSCIGDERDYSVVLSPNEDSLSDKAALHTIKFISTDPKIYSFLHRGSDERQFNTPNLNLGIVTLCKTKFGEFKEYHTSLDDMSLISQKGLEDGLEFAKNMILNLEIDKFYHLNTTCEPNLGSRGLISTINKGIYPRDMTLMRDFLAYCDGKRSVIDIAKKLGIEARSLKDLIENLLKFELIKEER